MKRFKEWLKSRKPKFYIKIILAVLIFSVLLIPSRLQIQNEETAAPSSEASEEQEEDQSNSKHEIHIGASNVIALAGALIALAVVKRRDLK